MSDFIDPNDLFDFTAPDGTQVVQQSEAWILETYPAEGAQIVESLKSARAKDATRDAVRTAITEKVGDQASILGTTADVTQLNAAAVLAFIAALGAGDTFPKFRTAFMTTIEALVPPTDGADVYAQAGAFLQAIQSGDVILTAALKGLPTVINEMGARSTGVAQVLIAASQAQAGE